MQRCTFFIFKIQLYKTVECAGNERPNKRRGLVDNGAVPAKRGHQVATKASYRPRLELGTLLVTEESVYSSFDGGSSVVGMKFPDKGTTVAELARGSLRLVL